jgi:hypothetical protein
MIKKITNKLIFNEFKFLTVSRMDTQSQFVAILCEALDIGHDNNTQWHEYTWNMYITASRMINDKTDIYDIHM